MCDLPMPGSPVSTTTRPSPCVASCQRRESISISSSRPSSGVSWVVCCASKRLAAPLAPTTCQAGVGSLQPLSATGPRSRYSKSPPVTLRVLAEITTVPGPAAACRRCAGLGGGWQARGEVRRSADDRLFLSGAFADQIAHHHRAGRDANAHCQRGVEIGPQISYSVDQREPGAHALRGVILVRLGIAEIDENAIAHVAGDDALIATDDLRDATVISTDHSAQVLRIEAGRKRRRAHQVANHHSEMTPLGSVFGGPIDCRKSVGQRYFRVCISAEGSDGVKKLSAMSDNTDAQILQVVCRQTRQDRLVDLIFAECRLIPFEAKAPQPTPDVHHRALL